MATKKEYLTNYFMNGVQFTVSPCSNKCWHCYFSKSNCLETKNVDPEKFRESLIILNKLIQHHQFDLKENPGLFFTMNNCCIHYGIN